MEQTYPTPSNSTAPPSPTSSEEFSDFSRSPSFYTPELIPDNGPDEPDALLLDDSSPPPRSSSSDRTLNDSTQDRMPSTSLPPSPSPLPPSSPIPSSPIVLPPSPSSPQHVDDNSDQTLINSSPAGPSVLRAESPDKCDLMKRIDDLLARQHDVVERQNELQDEVAEKEAALREAVRRADEAEARGAKHAASRLQLIFEHASSLFSLNKFRVEIARLSGALANAEMDLRTAEEESEDRERYANNLLAEQQRLIDLLHQEIDELRDQLLKCQVEQVAIEEELDTIRKAYERLLEDSNEVKEKLRVAEQEKVGAIQRADELQVQLNAAKAYIHTVFNGMRDHEYALSFMISFFNH